MDASRLLPDGVSVALLTPVDESGEPDLDAVDRLVTAALDGGVVGLSPVGSTGEGARLSRAQRRTVVERVAAAARGRPVLAGVVPGPIVEVREELAGLAEAGATGALVPPPRPYALSTAELAGWYADLAEASPLPLVLYHFPALGGPVPIEVVRRLVDHPRIVGLKDSGRDLEYLRSVVRAAEAAAGTATGTAGADFRVVTGADTLLPESLAAGAVGAIAASPNVAPSWAPELFAACRALAGTEGGEGGGGRGVDPAADTYADVRRRRDRLADLVAACRGLGFPIGWKVAAARVGRCSSRPVPPGHAAEPSSENALGQSLTEIDL